MKDEFKQKWQLQKGGTTSLAVGIWQRVPRAESLLGSEPKSWKAPGRDDI